MFLSWEERDSRFQSHCYCYLLTVVLLVGVAQFAGRTQAVVAKAEL